MYDTAFYAALGVQEVNDQYLWKGHWSTAFTAPGVPRTQAAIEGKNPGLAKRAAMGRREVVTTFIPNMANFMHDESESMFTQPSKQFKHTPTIENKDWRGAQLIQEGFRTQAVLVTDEKNTSTYAFPRGLIVMAADLWFKEVCEANDIDTRARPREQPALAKRVTRLLCSDAHAFLKLVYATADAARTWRHDLSSLLTHMKGFYILQEKAEKNGEYLLYDCTCPRFRMKAKCKHVIAYAAEMGKITVPTEKSLRTIGRKPRVGRPRKAKHPWQRLDSDQERTDSE